MKPSPHMNLVPFAVLALLVMPGAMAHASDPRVAVPGTPGTHPHGLGIGGWFSTSPSSAPANRTSAAMTYDTEDGYVLLFGGTGDNFAYLNDTWTYFNGNWTNITSKLATSPSGSASDLMSYDAADGYVVLYQGSQGLTWTYARGVWTELSGPGPSARWYSSMCYDSRDAEVVLFGGSVGRNTPLNDTWVFAHGTWSNISATAGPSPSPRWSSTMAYYPELNHTGGVVLFGGTNGTYLNDTWSFSSGHWAPVMTSPHAPSPRSGASMAWDAGETALLFLGGNNATQDYNRTWFFYNTSWYSNNFTSPSPRSGAAMAFDPAADGDLLFGGDQLQNNIGDTWIWKSFNAFATLVVTVTTSRSAIDLGNSVSLNATVHDWMGGNGVFHFWWSALPAGCTTSNQSAFTCLPSTVGEWPVELEVNSTSNASGIAIPLVIVANPVPQVAGLSISPSNGTLGSPVVFNVTVSGGTAPFSFHYTGLPPGCASQDATSFTCVPTAAGTYHVSVNVTDSAGSVAVRNATFTTRAPPPLSVKIQGVPTASSLGETVNLTANASGGLAPLSFAWHVNGTSRTVTTSPVLEYLLSQAGNYNFSVVVSDTLGHNATASAAVQVAPTVPPLRVSISVSASTVPSGGSILLAASATGGSGPYSYQWQENGTNVTANGSTWNLQLLHGGRYTFDVVVTDPSGGQVTSKLVDVNVSSPSPSSGNSAPALPESLLAAVAVVLVLAAITLVVGVMRRRRSAPPPAQPAAPSTTPPAPTQAPSPEPTPSPPGEVKV